MWWYSVAETTWKAAAVLQVAQCTNIGTSAEKLLPGEGLHDWVTFTEMQYLRKNQTNIEARAKRGRGWRGRSDERKSKGEKERTGGVGLVVLFIAADALLPLASTDKADQYCN